MKIFLKLKIETPDSLDTDEVAELGAKADAYTIKNEEIKKLQGVTKATLKKWFLKNIKVVRPIKLQKRKKIKYVTKRTITINFM